MRKPDGGFKIIHDSMGINDILVHSTKLDTKHASFFDFDLKPGETRLAAIPTTCCKHAWKNDNTVLEVVMGYSPILKQRFERIRLD